MTTNDIADQLEEQYFFTTQQQQQQQQQQQTTSSTSNSNASTTTTTVVSTSTVSLRQVIRLVTRGIWTVSQQICRDNKWQTVGTRVPLLLLQSSWYYSSTDKGSAGPVTWSTLADMYSPTLRVHDGNEWIVVSTRPDWCLVLQALRKDPDGKDTAAIDDDDDDDSYTNEQGTRYVRDVHVRDRWVHADWARSMQQQSDDDEDNHDAKKKKRIMATMKATTTRTKKRKKAAANFSARKAKCWIYVTGLPVTTNETAVAQFFSKAGLLALDPVTQRPKVKLYYKTEEDDDDDDDDGQQLLKGDASICYARSESVELALTLLDEATFYHPQDNHDAKQQQEQQQTISSVVRVQRAQFTQKGDQVLPKKRISEKQRKVAELAVKQARDWDEEGTRLTGGQKGLCIIVLKHLPLHDDDDDDSNNLDALATELRTECETFGRVEKITFFAAREVAIVKFARPNAASQALQEWDGKMWKERKVEAIYWDGVTDYTAARDDEKEEAEMEQRQKEFGDWLDNQELPPELQLKTE